MNKKYSIICILILISIISITGQISTSCGSLSPTKADDCKDTTLTQSQKDADYVHCCYLQFVKGSSLNSCGALTSKQYKKVGKYIDYLEENSNYMYEIKIDCQSSNLHLFLITLIIHIILL